MNARIDHPFFAGLKPTLHIAHRGGAALFPENTLLAFREAASRFGTDMLEIDVQLTRDGVVVVAHDDTVDRCTDGAGDICTLTFEELSRLDAGYRFTPDGGASFPFRGRGVRIPSLREVLEAFPTMRFNIEVKRELAGMLEAFCAELRRAGALERVCVGAVQDDFAARLHGALPEAVHFYPLEALTSFVFAVRMGEPAPEEPRFTVLDMPLHYEGMQIVDAPLVAAARRAGKWVNVWTIDAPAEMKLLCALGVGGVMTDRPDLLREVLGA